MCRRDIVRTGDNYVSKGVQLSDGLKLEAIADGGFSYAEIPYEIIEKK